MQEKTMETAIRELATKLAQSEVNNAMYVAKIEELEAHIAELEGKSDEH